MITKTKYAYILAQSIDIASVIRAFEDVEVAMEDDQSYEKLSMLVSAALEKFQESRIAMLDLRAYTFGMQGKFDEAVKDSETIIAHDAASLTGYFRLGSLYRMQGKQLLAIETYDRGLQSALRDHPDHYRIVTDREAAAKQSETHVDFVDKLSIEIVDSIMTLLSDESKSTCLTVSNIWRSKIVKCPKTWRTLQSVDDITDGQIIAVIPHIARHVESLVVGSTKQHRFMHYLRGMGDRRFTAIASLTLNAKASQHITAATMTPLSVALWQIRDTLTKFVVRFDRSILALTLVDILFACSNLKTLEYATTVELSSVIGDPKLISKHKALVDLQITAKLIVENDLRELLSRCPQVQRLLLYGCNSTILRNIDAICPNLKTLAYNADGTTIPSLNSMTVDGPDTGLCQLYTSNGGTPVLADELLPLIQRNMVSLKIIHAHMSINQPSSNITTTYTATLRNLQQLTFWGDVYDIIQPLVLRSLSMCTMLTHVSAVDSRDLHGLVNVLVSLPQLETLWISHDTYISSGSNDLVRLFSTYAQNACIERRLKSVVVHHYKKIVTDGVLAALGEIRTSESLKLTGLLAVSENGLIGFFKALGEQLSSMALAEMETITDKSLIAIGHMKGLKKLRLERLKNVSDWGVMDLIERAPKLQYVAFEKCPLITSNIISYGKGKGKIIIVNH